MNGCWEAVERIVYAGLVAAVAVVGPLVFQLLSRPRSDWIWGLAFAAMLGLVFGIWGGIDAPFEHSGAGQAAFIGVFIFVATFLAGMAGASVASPIARLFDPQPGRPPRHGRLQAWHVGAAIAGGDVVVVAALAAAIL